MKLSEKQIKILDIVLGVIGLIIAVVTIVTKCSSGDIRNEDEPEVEYISINHLLTNDMCDLECTKKLDNYINKFLQRWEIKGGSLAVMRDGKLIYAKGYGWADEECKVEMNSGHIFRVASLSKLVTAAAIMKMAEEVFSD